MLKNTKIATAIICMGIASPLPAFAAGVGKVFDYYEIAFSSLIEAGDRAAINEFTSLVADIGTKVEVIQSNDLGYSMKSNPNYIKNIVDGILGTNTDLYTGGRGYLYNWDTVSNGLKGAVSAKGVFDVANTLKEIGVSTKKFNDLAKEIGQLSARGDVGTIEWSIAVISAGYYSGSALNSLGGLGDESKETLELLLQNRNSGEIKDILTALQSDSAAYAVSEYRDLMLDEDGKRVIVQQLVIQHLSGPNGNDLIDDNADLSNQNLYNVQFVDRWWSIRNTYKGSIVSGSELFPDIHLDTPVYPASPEAEEPSADISSRNDDKINDDKTDIGGNDPDNGNGNQKSYLVGLSSQPTERSIYDTTSKFDFNPAYVGTGVKVSLPDEQGGGSVSLLEKYDIGNYYRYTNWGRWAANSETPSTYKAGGTWVSGVVTEASVLAAKTGSAFYKGEMIGDYVSDGVREDAVGGLELTANFGTNNLNGKMQWGHGNAGTIAGGPVSPLVTFDTPFYDGDGRFSFISDGNVNGTGVGYGISGIFLGDDGSEIGGTSWLVEGGGTYNGVFRVKEVNGGQSSTPGQEEFDFGGGGSGGGNDLAVRD